MMSWLRSKLRNQLERRWEALLAGDRRSVEMWDEQVAETRLAITKERRRQPGGSSLGR